YRCVLTVEALGRHLEVHDVAGVVLDDEEPAVAAIDRAGSGDDLVGRRRGEDLPRASGVEHPIANEAGVKRLVATAAARDEGDLVFSCLRSRYLNRVLMNGDYVAMCLGETAQR